MSIVRFLRRWVTSIVAASVAGACKDSTATLPPTPVVTVATSTVTVTQGKTGDATITVGRTDYAGPVSLSVEGAPAGVSATFESSTLPNPATTTTLHVSVAGAVAAQSYVLTVRAKASGAADATSSLPLTVTLAPSFTLSVSSAPQNVARGAAATVPITISRDTGYTSGVTLSAAGLPTGVTASFAPNPATGTTATLTLTAGPTAVLGNASVTIAGQAGAFPQKVAHFPITVLAAAQYALGASPIFLSVVQDGNSQTSVSVSRNAGFTGSVELNVEGAPAGITASFTPSSPIVGNQTTLTVAADHSAVVGMSTLTLRGTVAGQADVTISVPLTVAAGASGVIDFSFCGTIPVPAVWFAVQDGTGPWAQVPVGPNNTYFFSLVSNVGGIAWVAPDGPGFTLSVFYASQGEIRARGARQCAAPVGKTVSGVVTGLTSSQLAYVSLGGGAATILGPGGNFQATALPSGPFDLLAFALPLTGDRWDKVIIRRNLNVPDLGSITPAIDFGSAEALDPTTPSLTVVGAGAEQVFIIGGYRTAGGARVGIYGSGPGPAPSSYLGVPASAQLSGDLHTLQVSTGAPTYRVWRKYFGLATDQIVGLGPPLNTPSIIVLGPGLNARLQAQWAGQPEYNKYVSFFGLQQSNGGRRFSIPLSANMSETPRSLEFSVGG